MWPFKKQTPATKLIATDQMTYSQCDITESFGDNERLAPDEWISTIALNLTTPNAQTMGLPPIDASADDVYELASKLSQIRESISLPDDGVYCPICHIANTQPTKLRTPCPQCGRRLLKFGWD